MKKPLMTISLLMLAALTFGQSTVKTVTYPSGDGLMITADLYMTAKANVPFIILFHQAGYSRGEYLEIAPWLNAMGYNCLAVDQRSGDMVNGVVNQTHKRAEEAGKKTKYTDALPDMEASLSYVVHDLKAKKAIIWGSSYSSALVFVLAANHPDEVTAVLSFSPGEYFTVDNKSIPEYAAGVKCPVFITSAKNEQKYWQPIYDKIQSADKVFFLPRTEGYHGSKALWEKHQGYEEYWRAVKGFLEGVK